MKTMKKVFALLFSLLLVMSIGVPAFADGYSITINNAVNGQSYSAYKIFDVTYNSDKTAVAYTIKGDSAWYNTVKTYADETANGLTLTEAPGAAAGDVETYIVKFTEDTFSAASFAAALASAVTAEDASFTAADTQTASDTATLTVSEAGYYFVTSGTGALCSLDTVTGTNQEINEKNSYPTLTKQVQEDSKINQDGEWSSFATADIGQAVNFKLTVNTGSNTNALSLSSNTLGINADYVITDTLPNGMTCKEITSITSKTAIDSETKSWGADNDYSVSYENDILTITLKKETLDDLAQNTDIVIEYTATLDSDAVVGSEGNKNTAYLTYDTYKTTEVTATVYTYEFGLNKIDGKDETKTLENAEFTLSLNNKALYFIKETDGIGNTIYTHSKQDATDATSTITAGNVTIKGLDADTYTLTEAKAPAGYNLLTTTVSVTIGENGSVSVENTVSGTDDNISMDSANTSTVKVVNNAGTVLPSTGGIGTTIFYVVGGVLVLGAVVALIVKKRMSGYDD